MSCLRKSVLILSGAAMLPDLKGPGEWYNHFPPRQDGPNGQSCVACHNQPVEDGGGTTVSNINRDPFREGLLGHFVRRNAPHTMGMAGPQLVAEEMTAELMAVRFRASEYCCRSRTGKTMARLTAKGVDFGTLLVIRSGSARPGCPLTYNFSGVAGIDSDLVVKPFQWKGTSRFIREPSRNRDYRDRLFPAGQHPLAAGLDPAYPVSFDITRDQPGNIIRDEEGRIIARLGAFQKDDQGRAMVNLYSDLKRHDLGAEVAEPVDETASPVPAVPGTFQGGVGRSTFLTRPLWGVGSTAPYMQDGNSTTLTEAIERHGGEASDSRAQFRALPEPSREELIAFLNNLVIFKLEEGGEEESAGTEPTEDQMRRMR